MNLLIEVKDQICSLTFNRIEKHNAFDNGLLKHLQIALDDAIADPQVRVIVVKANGRHFSAGADLQWMQSMLAFSEEDNLADALTLAQVMYSLYSSPKPTLAVVQGSAFGGGAGLVAACDIAIAGQSARFCFSEVRLGLIPAVISPYVVKAIGARAAQALFLSAEPFDALQAKALHLIQHCVPEENLLSYAMDYAKGLVKLAPLAMAEVKMLVRLVDESAIDTQLIQETARLIAKKRISDEGQSGIKAFLSKQQPNWN